MLSPVEIALQMKVIPMFERLSTRQLMNLASVISEETYPNGSTIFEQDDEGTCMYLIVEGEVQVRRGDRVIATLSARDFFGEMAVLDSETRSATVLTQSPVRLLRLERRDLMGLIDEQPSIAVGMLQSLSARMRDMNLRIH